jgi:hypothetical protein
MLVLILCVVLGVVVVLAVIGFLLPREVTVERSIGIDRPGEAIYPWVADLRKWPEWSVWNATEDPTLAYTYSGADSGQGAAMSWTAKKLGNGTLTVTAAQPGRYLRYTLHMSGRAMEVRGNIEIEPTGGGATLVLWFDTVDLGLNPFRRWLGLRLKPMLRRVYRRNLAGLKTAAETGRATGPGPA